jgi:hypothetical protein
MGSRRSKQSPSAYQKQIRFLTGLVAVVAVFIASLAITLIFWLMNR